MMSPCKSPERPVNSLSIIHQISPFFSTVAFAMASTRSIPARNTSHCRPPHSPSSGSLPNTQLLNPPAAFRLARQFAPSRSSATHPSPAHRVMATRHPVPLGGADPVSSRLSHPTPISGHHAYPLASAQPYCV